jgi:tetratricopeptide (TPR) repeat protein
VLRRFIAAGRGLEASHAAGVAHRDFKPDNVLVGDDGRVRVVDFGLARVLADDPADRAAPPDGAPEEAGERGGVGEGTDPGADDGAATDRGESAFATGDTARQVSAALRGVGIADASTARYEAEPVMSSLQEVTPATRLTRTGVMMGTLPFTAPEQLSGVAADHRSDQFSFCVALYHALYGEFPFPGGPPQDLPKATAMKVRGLEHGVGVGGRLRKALRRGLSVEAGERFDSMGDLLAMLEPGMRPRSVGIAGAVLLFVIAAIAMFWPRPDADPCASAGRGFAASWSVDRRLAVRVAFARSDLPYADRAWSSVARQVDDYVERWRSEAETACRATHVDHVQSGEQLDRRMLCLERGQRHLAALVSELATGSADAIRHGSDAAGSLPELRACGRTETVLFGPEPPSPAIAGRVEAVERQLAEAATLERIGRFDEALAASRNASTIAERLSYPPVTAEVLVQTARALDGAKTAAARGEAEALYFQALDLAEAGRQDALAAAIWGRLVTLAVRMDPGTQQARAWWRRYAAAVSRTGGGGEEQRRVHHLLAEIEYRDGKFAEAEAQARTAIAALPDEAEAPLELSRYLDTLAKALESQNRHGEAFTRREHALHIATGVLGASHPEVIRLQANYGLTLRRRGELARARAVLEAALAGMPPRYRETSHDAALVYNFLSGVAGLEGRLDDAAALGRHGLEIARRAGVPDYRLAEAYTTLGAVELRRERFDAALELYTEARRFNRALAEDDDAVGSNEGNLAEALAGLSRFDEALQHVRAAERVFERGATSRPRQGWILVVRGELLVEQRRLREAVPLLERARQLVEGGNDRSNEGRAHWALARALHGLGEDAPRVRRLAERAQELFTAPGADAHRRRTVAAFLGRLGQCRDQTCGAVSGSRNKVGK